MFDIDYDDIFLAQQNRIVALIGNPKLFFNPYYYNENQLYFGSKLLSTG